MSLYHWVRDASPFVVRRRFSLPFVLFASRGSHAQRPWSVPAFESQNWCRCFYFFFDRRQTLDTSFGMAELIFLMIRVVVNVSFFHFFLLDYLPARRLRSVPPPSTVPADGGVETAQNWMNLGCVRPNSTVWIVSFFFSSDGLRQVAGMLCVFSLYTLWKEEKNVNRRLRDLTMVISPNFIQFLLFFFTLINAIRQSIRHHQPNQSIASESFLGPRIGLLAFLLGYFYFWKKRSSTTGWVYFDTILSGIFSVFLCAFLFFSTALLFFLRISIYFGFIKFNLAYWVFTEWCKRSLP